MTYKQEDKCKHEKQVNGELYMFAIRLILSLNAKEYGFSFINAGQIIAISNPFPRLNYATKLSLSH